MTLNKLGELQERILSKYGIDKRKCNNLKRRQYVIVRKHAARQLQTETSYERDLFDSAFLCFKTDLVRFLFLALVWLAFETAPR